MRKQYPVAHSIIKNQGQLAWKIKFDTSDIQIITQPVNKFCSDVIFSKEGINMNIWHLFSLSSKNIFFRDKYFV